MWFTQSKLKRYLLDQISTQYLRSKPNLSSLHSTGKSRPVICHSVIPKVDATDKGIAGKFLFI